MDLTTVHIGMLKRPKKKRVGRGPGSGHGKTASRGHKGQYASAGAEMFSSLFEGGQMPLYRRSPKRGFSHATWDISHVIINLGDLDRTCEAGEDVTLASLKTKRVLRGTAVQLRVLGEGSITKKLTIHAHHFSKSATEKITAAGGQAIVLPQPKKPVRNKMKPRPAKTEG